MLWGMCPLSYGKFMRCLRFFCLETKQKHTQTNKSKKTNNSLCLLAQCLACLEYFVVQSLSHIQLLRTSWTSGHQAFLSITISQSLLKLMSIELVMPSNHLFLCHALPILPSILPRIRVFSNESALHIRWPKYWSFSFSIRSFQWIQCLFPLGLTDLISLQSKGLSRVFSSTTVGKHQFFSTQPSLWSNSQICTWLLKKL